MTRCLALLFPLLLLTACDSGPAQNCDYCRAMRNGVQRYLCDKCTKPHAACDSERSILHYTESGVWRGQASYSATSILTCPAPRDEAEASSVAQEPVVAPLAPPDATFLPKMVFWQKALFFWIGVVVFFVGYVRGRIDRGLGIKLGNKKEISK